MAAPTYSERFTHGNVAATVTYTVPAGYRAVVRSVSGVNARNDATGYVVVMVGGIRCVQRYPAVGESLALEMRQVCYAGETITQITSLTNIDVAVSGYLLKDPSGAKGPPGGMTVRELPEVRPG